VSVYKSVLLTKVAKTVSENGEETVQELLKTFFKDPFVKILLNNSHLTKTQLETVLINRITAINQPSNKLSKPDKGRLRLRHGGVSKGSFYRTLSQAKANIDKTLFTVLLLGYIGILDSPSLTPFLELSNKLKTYIAFITGNESGNEHNRLNNNTNLRLVQNRLIEEVKTLIKP